MTNRPVSHAHEDAAADELRAALRTPEPLEALTVSNFSKAMFVVIALGVGLGCLFAAMPGA